MTKIIYRLKQLNIKFKLSNIVKNAINNNQKKATKKKNFFSEHNFYHA